MTDQTQQTMFSSNRDDWETPQDFFDKLNEQYHFTLDPCSSDTNTNVQSIIQLKTTALNRIGGAKQYFATRHTLAKAVKTYG